MLFTVLASYFITFGAVSPLPYFSNAECVANLTILDAKAGPYSKSHNEHTEVTPAKMSPIPPHRFFPPSVRTMKDLSFPIIISCVPLITSLKWGNAYLLGNSVISYYDEYLFEI